MILHTYLNGEMLSANKAALNLNDLGLIRGYGMFDYFRTYNGVPFRFDDYWQRFENSAKHLFLPLPISKAETRQILTQLYELSGHEEVGFRFLLTGGYSPDSFSVTTPNFAICCESLPKQTDEVYKKGIKVLPFEFVRDLPEIKTTNYLNMIRLAKEMRAQNATDLLYFKDGEISELTRSNFFIIKGNTLITPNHNILNGITKKVVLELAKSHFKIEERPLYYQELEDADESFTTSSTKWVMPIVQVGRLQIGDGRVGEGATKLLELFKNEAFKSNG